jgi:small subunit ribosomal protein S6
LKVILMPIVTYETLFALDSTKISSEGDAIRGGLLENMKKYGAEILIDRPWDENGKLAYPINKQKKAYFYIVYYKMESTSQEDLAADFRINENVLRQMTSKLELKWSETLLDIARNDGHRFALKNMTDDTAALGEGIVSNDPLVRGEIGVGGDMAPAPAPRGRGRRKDADDKPE